MQTLPEAAKAQIIHLMARQKPAHWISATVEQNFHIQVDREQMLAVWHERNLPRQQDHATTTGPGPECATTTGPGPERATTTGPGPERATTTGPGPEHATTTEPGPDHATTTQPLQRAEPMAILDDEIKAFIVRGLARYETPKQVAAAVKLEFGIEITRQQVHEYNPQGSRPPALRWCELHAVTREKFLADLAGIGVAHKVVRLQMLDRFTRRAIDENYSIKAAAFLEQAAKEVGGIYESRRSAAAARELPPPPKGHGL
jgi:hypothetical protein